MIKYYPKINLSLSEVNNQPTLLIYSLEGCNLNCYKCFNRNLIDNKYKDYYTINDIINYIKLNENIFESIVFSGGEYLVSSSLDIFHDLSLIKSITKKPIIIYTNGFLVDKIFMFTESPSIKNIVDGFHIDMKLPYHLLDIKKDKELIIKALGIKLNENNINNPLTSISYVIKNDKGYSQVRSVKYPFLDESAFIECEKYIQEVNKFYGKNVPYFTNEFVEI